MDCRLLDPRRRASRALATAAAASLAATALALAGCDRGERTPARHYRDYCARCHGRDGAGMQRPDGFDPGLDLTTSAMVAEGRRDEIARRIAVGEGTMPGFSHRLSGDEIDRLVEFVLGFAATSSKAQKASD